ncbi:MAG: MazG nucleotide pyrophosphohydrolase domain-containing protein [Micrococcus sp.]|nr:MazG nucleotide pyrophosphohydrolase domain-containing protein [Micrococcus sp.]
MSAAVDRLVEVVEALRTHCPWTAALTHAQLTEYLVEESYEVLEVIEARTESEWADVAARRADGSYAALAAEFGDVLFQVVLHAAVSRAPDQDPETAGFRLDDAARVLTAKMVRRNPHIFTPGGELRPAEELRDLDPLEIERAWERIKAQEKAEAARDAAGARPVPRTESGPDAEREVSAERTAAAPSSAFDALPPHLPALAAAAKGIDRAARSDTADLEPPAPEVWPAEIADEASLGAHLFALVQHARAAGLDPERALRTHVSGRRTTVQ